MTAKEVKQFILQHLGIKARVITIPCKARWVEATVMGQIDPVTRQSTFMQAFSEPFRRACLKTVYPNSPVGDQASGGNISTHRIAMQPHEWGQATVLFQHVARQP